MLSINKINGYLSNGKQVYAKKKYSDKKNNFQIDITLWRHNKKIRLEIVDYDVDLDEKCGGGLECDLPIKKREIKDFNTLEEALDYIFKTTILTEEDFPNKFKIKKDEKDD